MKANLPVRRARGRLAARTLAPLAAAALLFAGATACDSDTSSEGTDQGVHTLTPEPEESPAESPSPRTQQSFAASVSAESERVRQEAAKRLDEVEGRGNAVGDVSVNGLPVTASEEVRSALVRVTNPTDKAAFYAVKVEFVDAEDKVLDTVVVGVEDAPPDRTVNVQANSRKAAGVKTFPRVAQAERG
ncbi:hypothetical protein ACFYUM_13850 [Streptomyces fimicarius]|uniref:Lipoprotein n=1 Tax=Streptomyces caviscabies TaxID=90079 RepID=A0ABW2ML61_9ACTN|nr:MULTISPECIES: hypothetical protein [Streptomyces]MCL6289730.1 hypothetical protein [Streptomyces sp. 43Y-GA-1]MCX4713448.1 hypothetical protein [Streptomyces griseus]MDX2672822.1 hypothetical protein [Streptomyces sp. NRRL_ISP-5395]MDX3503881.1 hypothetical protein [Streptomyces sp. ATCC51928]MDX5525849.1 hypothetical protein [Streptomyces sp. DE06-01C]